MDSTDSSILIGRLERAAEEWPQLYTAKVAAVAALGYAGPALAAAWILTAWFFLIYSLIADGVPSTGAIVACVAGIAVLLGTIRALWLPVEKSAERRIAPEDAPELFRLIEAAEKLSGVSLEAVTINREFRASIRQIPRWSVFGNYRSHLQLGVPLLAALSVEEFAAVLAHEMGHCDVQCGRFDAWIYRQRLTWNALRTRFEEPSNLFVRALARFYGWYIPYFHAYSLILARNHEYAADQRAVVATDKQILAQALVKLDLMERFLAEVFWARLFSQVEKLPEPPRQPYSLMQRAFHVAQKEWARREWLAQALARYARDDDTHPSLADRLAALDVEPALPAYDPETCALSFLGPLAPELIRQCDRSWHEEHLAAWRQRHREIQEARWKIAQYEQYDASELGPEDLWAKANLLLTVNRHAEGIETLQMLVARPPGHAQAHLLLGQLLLERSDEHGLQHLILAAEQDAGLASTAGTTGYSYLVNRGRKPEALRFWKRLAVSG